MWGRQQSTRDTEGKGRISGAERHSREREALSWGRESEDELHLSGAHTISL